MKYLLFVFAFAAFAELAHAQKPSADTLVAKSALLKNVADHGEALTKEFQYSLSPQQRDIQDRIRQAAITYSIYSGIAQDSIKVKK